MKDVQSPSATPRQKINVIQPACHVENAVKFNLVFFFACDLQAVNHHFWLKRHEVIQQIEGWITEMEASSGDKRTGRTISHSCVALKVSSVPRRPLSLKLCKVLASWASEVVILECTYLKKILDTAVTTSKYNKSTTEII